MLFDDYPEIDYDKLSKAINDIDHDANKSQDDLTRKPIEIISIGGCHGHAIENDLFERND